MRRFPGVPFLYAAASAAVGFSIYFSIGVVADRGLGLTPLIFLAAGLMFALTSLSYVEGGAMLRERGGSATFARHAFNELVSFIAGWAILIDYLIVIAAAAITVSHYLTPISGDFAGGGAELAIAVLVIGLAAILNIADVTGRNRQRRLVVLALAELGLQLLVIVVGLIVVLHPDRLTDQLDLFSSPSIKDIVYSLVIATIAYAGIEAASDLAPDLEFEPRDLKRVLGVGAIAIPLIYAGIAAVALMAVPVVPGPDGPETALAGRYIEEPILGVVANYDHGWLSDFMKWAVMLIAVPVLFWAANTAMLGLSRHVYVLATNRQIPSWAGRLERTYSTPYIAIGIAAVLALALAIPGDIRFLARVYAFGALLAVTIAQLSIVRLRMVEPDLERPYRVPLNVRIGSADLPLPAIVRGGDQRPRLDQRLRPAPQRRLRRWGLDAVRARLLRDLPALRRGHATDQARSGSGDLAEEAAGGGRVLDHPGARSSAPSSTTTSSARPVGSPTRRWRRASGPRGWTSSTSRSCRSRCRSTRRCRRRCGSAPTGRSSAPVRSGTSTRTSR